MSPGRGRLRRIGRVLHVTRAGDLVLRSNSGFAPRIGDRAYGPDLRPVGFIADVFGPVSSPYVMVRPLVDDPHELVGKVLYVGRGKGRRWRS
ncbi:MAG TPA: H/ACA RNA-protein complex protein Gar1 [Candidatus Bathyarchaeota archaeon]|nr:H/ACA RNA-protein complex protein Gar1 [Candidatus Bathyarchaeota archaeon]